MITSIRILNLLEKCNKFTKLASMLLVPPMMLEDLHKKITFIYAGAVLYYLNSLQKTEEINKIIQEIEKYSKKPLSLDHNIILPIDINLDNWSPLNEKMQNNLKNMPNNLSVVFTKTPHSEQCRGSFNFLNNRIIIFISNIKINTLKEFLKNLDDLKETARHELQHYSQLLLSYLISDNKFHGLPPPGYRKKFPQSSNNLSALKSDLSEHSLKNMEFYTNLQDSINDFKNILKEKNIKGNMARAFAKSWIGVSNDFFELMHEKIESSNYSDPYKEILLGKLLFFSKIKPPFDVLKRKDEKKWKLASKIFWTQVQDLF